MRRLELLTPYMRSGKGEPPRTDVNPHSEDWRQGGVRRRTGPFADVRGQLADHWRTKSPEQNGSSGAEVLRCNSKSSLRRCGCHGCTAVFLFTDVYHDALADGVTGWAPNMLFATRTPNVGKLRKAHTARWQ